MEMKRNIKGKCNQGSFPRKKENQKHDKTVAGFNPDPERGERVQVDSRRKA